MSNISTGRNAVVSLVLFIIFSVIWFNFGLATQLMALAGGTPILDNTPGYSVADAESLLAVYGEEGRNLYRRFLYVDYVYGALFAVTAFLVLDYLWRHILGRKTALTWVFLLLILGSFCLECIENTTMLSVLGGNPNGLAVTSQVSAIKFGYVNVVTIGIVVSGVLAVAMTVRRRLNHRTAG